MCLWNSCSCLWYRNNYLSNVALSQTPPQCSLFYRPCPGHPSRLWYFIPPSFSLVCLCIYFSCSKLPFSGFHCLFVVCHPDYMSCPFPLRFGLVFGLSVTSNSSALFSPLLSLILHKYFRMKASACFLFYSDNFRSINIIEQFWYFLLCCKMKFQAVC